ncbi:MAG: hypothetical protein R2690_18910 [Acidimicrobiales bacterium]
MDAAVPLDPPDADADAALVAGPAPDVDDPTVAATPELDAFEPLDSLGAIAAFLGVEDPGELVAVTEVLDDRNLFPTGAALLAVLLDDDDAVLDGIEGFGPPRWFPFDPRDASSAVPLMGWLGVGAGAGVAGVPGPLALRIGLGPLGTTLEVFGTGEAPQAPADALAALTELRRDVHPLRGRVVRVSGAAGNLSYRLVPPQAAGRERLVLPAAVWDVVDHHVHGFLAAGDRLVALGMGMHVGVLVVGAAGTGKTALCRVLAEELRDEATTLLVDPVTARDSLAELYALASLLAPTLVVIEHVEGAGPTRHRRPAGAGAVPDGPGPCRRRAGTGGHRLHDGGGGGSGRLGAPAGGCTRWSSSRCPTCAPGAPSSTRWSTPPRRRWAPTPSTTSTWPRWRVPPRAPRVPTCTTSCGWRSWAPTVRSRRRRCWRGRAGGWSGGDPGLYL